MKSSKWRYKDYYERHKDQEKQRTNVYYHEHREEILAKRKEKRRQQPKKVRLTPIDYQSLWIEMFSYTKHSFPFWHLLMEKFENDRLKTKEMLKDEI